MRLTVIAALVVSAAILSGCAVAEVGGAVVGAGVSVVSTGVSVAGDVAGGAVHAATGGSDSGKDK